jgi:transcriptional regulator with XRE-family HTH domain
VYKQSKDGRLSSTVSGDPRLRKLREERGLTVHEVSRALIVRQMESRPVGFRTFTVSPEAVAAAETEGAVVGRSLRDKLLDLYSPTNGAPEAP